MCTCKKSVRRMHFVSHNNDSTSWMVEILLGKCIPRSVYIVLKLVRREIDRIQKLVHALNIFSPTSDKRQYIHKNDNVFVPIPKINDCLFLLF